MDKDLLVLKELTDKNMQKNFHQNSGEYFTFFSNFFLGAIEFETIEERYAALKAIIIRGLTGQSPYVGDTDNPTPPERAALISDGFIGTLLDRQAEKRAKRQERKNICPLAAAETPELDVKILERLAEGKTYNEISQELSVDKSKIHRAKIKPLNFAFEKFNINLIEFESQEYELHELFGAYVEMPDYSYKFLAKLICAGISECGKYGYTRREVDAGLTDALVRCQSYICSKNGLDIPDDKDPAHSKSFDPISNPFGYIKATLEHHFDGFYELGKIKVAEQNREEEFRAAMSSENYDNIVEKIKQIDESLKEV